MNENVVVDKYSNDALLYQCEPIYWKNSMNKTMRMTIGWLLLVVRRNIIKNIIFLLT